MSGTARNVFPNHSTTSSGRTQGGKAVELVDATLLPVRPPSPSASLAATASK